MGEVIHRDSASWNHIKDFSGAPEGGDAEVPTWRTCGCGLLLLYNYYNVGRLPAEFLEQFVRLLNLFYALRRQSSWRTDDQSFPD